MNASGGTTAGLAPINGAELYCEAKGSGAPIVFLHAGVADARMWDRQFEEFARTNRVIRFDLRGFGRSGKSPGSYAHHADAAALLTHLGVESTHVVGASFGGAVAINLALACPRMVASLVLAAPALGGYEFTSAQVQGFFAAEEEALARGDLEAAVEANLRMWVDGVGRHPSEVNQEVRARVREMQLNTFSRPNVADAVETELSPPAIDRLPSIAVPALLIVGDRDAAEFQALAALVAGRIPNARVAVVHGAAHLPSMENPGEFNSLVRETLAATPIGLTNCQSIDNL